MWEHSLNATIPLVSAIIVHYSEPAHLWNCIRSLARLRHTNLEVIVVDNGSPKLSASEMPALPLPIRYISSPSNRGFGDGCNQGIRAARGEYVFLLNNDVECDPDCITEMVSLMTRDGSIGILQPKMLDLQDQQLFHSSAGGGLMDFLGYPFARGRIFEAVERDRGQYDQSIEVFWAGGAALFARKDVVEKAGLFDPDFFLYMEEIDLAWRVHLLGRYRVVYVPSARIYHLGCPNLGREHFLRMYYVHRNSLVMLLKNYAWVTLLAVMPARLALDGLTALGPLFVGRWKRCGAILRALGYTMAHLPAILRKRREVQSRRRVSDLTILARMHRGSIALRYYLAGKDVGRAITGISIVEYAQGTRRAC